MGFAPLVVDERSEHIGHQSLEVDTGCLEGEDPMGIQVSLLDQSERNEELTLCFPPGIQYVRFGFPFPAPCIRQLDIWGRGIGQRGTGRTGDRLRLSSRECFPG